MNKNWSFIKKHGFNIVCVMIVATSILYSIFLGTVVVKGSSMEPTYSTGDIALLRRDNKKIDYGDMVTIDGDKLGESLDSDFNDMIKRVIGTPGQKVAIIDNDVYIDDVLLEEDYIRSGNVDYIDFEIQLGDEEFFVMGDNRDFSMDSRIFGPITRDMINGYTLFTIKKAK